MKSAPPLAQRLSAALRGRNVLQLLSELGRRSAHAGAHALHRHVLRQRFIEKRIYDYRLVLDSHDPGISRQLLERGSREAEQKAIVERVLKPGMVALDLGANLGYYTIMMARLAGERGHVYAVEPYPQSFRLLEENVRRNGLGNVSLENLAIAAHDGVAQLLVAERSNWHSLHSACVDMDTPWQAKYARTFVGAVPVRSRSLRSYVAGKEPIDLLRMDLEGYEVEILRQVSELPRIRGGAMRILFETHPEFYSSSHNDMRAVLEHLCYVQGYTFEYLISDYQHGSGRQVIAQTGRSVFAGYGYASRHIVTEFRNRAIYTDLRLADAIELVCTSEYVHAALLSPGCR